MMDSVQSLRRQGSSSLHASPNSRRGSMGHYSPQQAGAPGSLLYSGAPEPMM